MRALFGLRPRRRAREVDAAHEFEEALSFWSPRPARAGHARARTPWARMQAARDAARRDHLRRDRPAARGPASAARTCSACCSTRTDEEGARLSRPARPRRGHDAAVRRPRHDDLDDRVPLLRAGRATREASATRDLDLAARRDAAPVPAGVDRAAALDRAVRALRRARSPAASRSTTTPGPATGCPTSGSEPDAFDPQRFAAGPARDDPQGRLRPLRRRLAHLHRHALRPGRDRTSSPGGS